MCHQPRRACDHENAIERCGVYSQVGKDRADGSIHIDRERFLGIGECFFDGARCLHVHAVHAGFAREFEQARSAWVFRVKTVTEAGHSFASFPHRCERARSGFID